MGGWSFNLDASYCVLYTFSLNFNEETSFFSHVTSPQVSQVILNIFSLNFNEETSSFSHVTSPQVSQVTLNTFTLNFNEETSSLMRPRLHSTPSHSFSIRRLPPSILHSVGYLFLPTLPVHRTPRLPSESAPSPLVPGRTSFINEVTDLLLQSHVM